MNLGCVILVTSITCVHIVSHKLLLLLLKLPYIQVGKLLTAWNVQSLILPACITDAVMPVLSTADITVQDTSVFYRCDKRLFHKAAWSLGIGACQVYRIQNGEENPLRLQVVSVHVQAGQLLARGRDMQQIHLSPLRQPPPVRIFPCQLLL